MLRSTVMLGGLAGACLGGATAVLFYIPGVERILYCAFLGGAALQFIIWAVVRQATADPGGEESPADNRGSDD